MTSREQFEAWASNQYPFDPIESILLRIGPDKEIYHLKVIQRLWEAWQASREAVEIELPSVTDAADWLVSVDVMESEHVISAIRTAGIKFKVE